jgi:hypothetical protein
MYRTLLACIPFVVARYMITAQWIINECSGPPDMINAWMLTDESTAKAIPLYQWPWGYTYQAVRAQRPYSSRCLGYLKTLPSKECCMVLRRTPKLMLAFRSAATILADKASPLLAAPADANQAWYCQFRAQKYDPRNDAFGYDVMYAAANGMCIDELVPIRCFPNKTLSLYSFAECKGPPTQYDVSQATTIPFILNTGSANVSVDFIQVQGASSTFSWTSYHPFEDYSPNFTAWHEYLMLINFSSALIFLLYSLFSVSRMFWRKATMHSFYKVVSQILWIVYAIVRFASTFGNRQRPTELTADMFLMLASLLSIVLSENLYFSIEVQYSKLAKLVYLLTICVNVGLNWNIYAK